MANTSLMWATGAPMSELIGYSSIQVDARTLTDRQFILINKRREREKKLQSDGPSSSSRVP